MEKKETQQFAKFYLKDFKKFKTRCYQSEKNIITELNSVSGS